MGRAPDRSGSVAERLQRGAQGLGVELDGGMLADLESYLGELQLWNSRLNLVGEHERDTLADRHVIDSFAAVPLLRALGERLRIVDVGSGAGLPGVPLAVALRPEEMLLVEPRRKRASFLRAVRRLLPAAHLTVREAHAVDLLTGDDASGRYDAIVSRAALPDEELLETASSVLRDGGLLIAYRGGAVGARPQPGRDSAPTGFAPPTFHPYRLTGAARDFTLVAWKRIRFT